MLSGVVFVNEGEVCSIYLCIKPGIKSLFIGLAEMGWANIMAPFSTPVSDLRVRSRLFADDAQTKKSKRENCAP